MRVWASRCKNNTVFIEFFPGNQGFRIPIQDKSDSLDRVLKVGLSPSPLVWGYTFDFLQVVNWYGFEFRHQIHLPPRTKIHIHTSSKIECVRYPQNLPSITVTRICDSGYQFSDRMYPQRYLLAPLTSTFPLVRHFNLCTSFHLAKHPSLNVTRKIILVYRI